MRKEPLNMEFTGERFVPEAHGNIELEHLHRYLQACEISSEKVVLDIASGEGYGSAMLANYADKVMGVDISAEAVKHARRRYKKNNLEYMVGSCADIPLPDASVDLVVSFETIEHHDQHIKMMQEIKRVLRPTGSLLISSPDKYNYSVEPSYCNPYHIKELYQHEFKQLLGNYFKSVAYFGQRVVYGSAIFTESLATPALSYWQENGVVKEATGTVKPIYWIALASDVDLPKLASGVFEQPINDSEIIQSWSRVVSEREGQIANLNQTVTEREGQIANLNQTVTEREGQIANLNQTVTEHEGQIANLNQTVTEREGQIANLNQTVTEREGQIANLNQTVTERERQVVNLTDETVRRGKWALGLDSELKAERAQLSAVTKSNSWCLTLPLREARRWVSSPTHQAKRYIKSTLRIAKRAYQLLPLSFQTKTKHRQLIAKKFPQILQFSGSHSTTIPVHSAPQLVVSQKSIYKTSELTAVFSTHAFGFILPVSESPTVSVIIPIYGKIDYTLRCIRGDRCR
jgi:ubiquinone/menaquinone biosynthesis C-methylase UbiE/uncharacterized coiled-coil protein SlyX